MSGMMDRRAMIAAALGASLAPARALAAPDLAARLYRRAMVIDGNLVGPLDSEKPLEAASVKAVKASGLTAFKMTIGGSHGNFADTNSDIAEFDKAIALSAGLYMKVTRAAHLAEAKRSGRVGIIYSFEAADMLEGKPERVDHFAALGVRVMQLGYNLGSPFGSGVLSPQPSPGLTALGREAVARMEASGVTLDLSHADETTSLGALAVARKTPLVTHAGCAAVHAHPRNKSDAVLKALAAKGGVVGIYELSFIDAGPEQQTLAHYMDHLAHALKVCGQDHVGIGSDAILEPFDTSAENMAMWNQDIEARKKAGVSSPGEGRPPYVEGLNRPDRGEVICRELLKRGYPVRVAEKVLGSNFARVFAETWPG